VPVTPSPVTLNNDPAGGGCLDLISLFDVVTYKMSSLGPPKATLVTCSAGILMSNNISPELKVQKNSVYI
jgi:hypothetical protein